MATALTTRQLRVYFGGTLVFDSGALTIATNDAWIISCTAQRVSASVVRCTTLIATEIAAITELAAYVEVTGLTLANTQIFKVTGTAAGATPATNDIVCKMGNVEFKPSTPDVISSSVQGDILYHNATVWTRLAAGTAGQVLQTGGAGASPSWADGEGTSNPGSPAAGDRFWRTDLNLGIFYDGTQWLSQQQHTLACYPLDSSILPRTTSGTPMYAPNPWVDKWAIYIEEVAWWWSLTGTGNWTVIIQSVAAGVVGTTFGSKTISAAGADGDRVAVGSSVTSSHERFQVNFTENSGTASIYAQPAIIYRLIIT